MEIKVNDYVRTKDGKIGKIIQEEYITPCNDKHRYIYLTDTDNEMWYDEDTIIKSSPQIIDLIEVGDYVNGHLVFYVGSDSIEVFWYKDEKQWLDKEDIKFIVTKEMFEKMEYKIN